MKVLRCRLSLLTLWAVAGSLHAQQVPSAAIEGVKGVQQDATASVKEPVPPQTKPAATIHDAHGVKKVEGVDKVEGVKPPPQKPVAPPPPPKAIAAPAASTSTVRPVQGITGIEALKRQNLETALQIKVGGATPAGTGAEKGGKGKAAAAALLSGNAEAPPSAPGPKEDGRAKLQEVKKLLDSGS